MRRILAIVILALLPLQFSWAAVAVYCGHEERADGAHFGHHEHQHYGGDSGAAEPLVDLDATADVNDGKVPGVVDLDCGQCHGIGSLMLTLPSVLHDAFSMEPPSATGEEATGPPAPTRPERPKWLPLA